MKVRWLNSGIRSLRAIHAHIALDNPAAASRVALRVRDATTRLQSFPASGRLGQVPGTMELIIPSLPYIVVYRMKDETIEILRIFHTAMNWPEHIQ